MAPADSVFVLLLAGSALSIPLGPLLGGPRVIYFMQPSDPLSRPIVHPELGMTPQYHNLVYNYINGFAGKEKPAEVFVQQPVVGQPQDIEEFGVGNRNPELDEGADPDREETTEGPLTPVVKDILPSDFILLSTNPRSQFFGNFNAIKMKKMKYKDNKETLPPLGGVVSNYVLLREKPSNQVLLPFGRIEKRQAYFDGDDSIVIQSDGRKKKDEEKPPKEEEKEDEIPQEQPAVAQSKPSAIALAGPGGVAQASPVGTALVGPGGLAVSAPSGTAVAGPAGQGAIIASSEDKMKTLAGSLRKEPIKSV